MKKKLALVAAAGLILWLVAVVGANRGNAPDFQLVDLDGRRAQLNDFRGRAVVMKFWSLGCPACIRALPELAAAAEQLGDAAVVILVNVMDDPEIVRRAVDRYQITMRVLLDVDGTVTRRYQVRGLPTYAFISPAGRLVDSIPGRLDAETLIMMTRRALER